MERSYKSFRDWQLAHALKYGPPDRTSRVFLAWYRRDYKTVFDDLTKAFVPVAEAFKQFAKSIAPIAKELNMFAASLNEKTLVINTCSTCHGVGKRGNRTCSTCHGSGRGKPLTLKV